MTPRRFREWRLLWKLLVPFATILVLVSAFSAFLLVRDQATRAQADLDRDLLEISLQVRSALQQHELHLLESANLAANLQGMAEAAATGDTASIEQLLRSVVALKSGLDLAGVVGGPDVQFQVALDPSGAPVTDGIAPTAAPVASALASIDGGRVAGLVPFGETTLLTIAAPICTQPDPCMPVGSAVVARDLRTILADIAASDLVGRLDGGGLAMFALDGSLAASTGTTPPRRDGFDAGRQVRLTDEVDDASVQTLYSPYHLQGRHEGTVTVSLPAALAFAAVQATGRRLTVVLLVGLLAIVGIGALVSRAILGQVRPLLETNRRLGSGDLTARTPIVSGDEIGEVARGLNQMAEQLQASYETLEVRVMQRTAEIERLMRQRTEFFASLSHELRTPLAIILSQTDIMLLDDHGDDVTETGRAIRQSAVQLLAVVSEILELARAEAGTLDVDAMPLELPAFVEELQPTLGGLAATGDVHLTVQVEDALPLVAADPARLREILINLIDNAVKYSPPGASVVLGAAVSADRVVVTVTDNGSGIPPDVGERIFEPFFRVEGNRLRAGRASSGLGLALTRRLIEAHGGQITYDSQVGAGTTFRFDLPVAARPSPHSATGRTPADVC